MLNNSMNYRYQVPMQGLTPEQIRAAVQASQQQYPQASMQGVDPQQIKERMDQRVDNNYTVNRLNQMGAENPNDMLKQYALAVPIWYGLSQSMDYFAKKCRGEYKDTAFYKIGNFGDELVDTVNNSSVGKSGFAQGFSSKVKGLNKWFNKNIVQKSAILRSFSSTPTVPYHDMVRGQAAFDTGALAFDYPQVAENFLKPIKYVEDLDCYGADSSFIKKIKDEITKAPTAKARNEILERAQFELLSSAKSPADIANFKALSVEERAKVLKDLKAKAFGYNDAAHLEKITKDIHNHIDDVIQASQKAKKNVYSKIWAHDNNFVGKAQGHLFGRKVFASEFANKLTASLGTKNTNHRTWLGKMLPKFTNIFLEGSTNRIAGGKFVAAMQAFFLAECLMKTAQAEGTSEKVKTFVERFTEMLGFFIMTPVAINLWHRFGGIQYAGMSDDFVKNALNGLKRKNFKSDAEFEAAKKLITEFQDACKSGKKPHEAYRQVLKDFNERSLRAGWTKAEHKGGEKALRHILKGDTRNPFTKLVKKLARIGTVGLEQIRPYTKDAVKPGFMGKLKEIFKHPKYWFKQGAGYPMRLIPIMFVLMPFLNNSSVKFIHKIFGRPEHSVLDKEDEVSKQPQPIPGEVYQPYSVKQPLPVQGLQGNTNLLDKYKQNTQSGVNNNQQVAGSTSAPIQQQQTVRRYIPSPEGVKINSNEPQRTYVPSPMGVQVDPKKEDPTAANQAMMRADLAEQKALEVLKMH